VNPRIAGSPRDSNKIESLAAAPGMVSASKVMTELENPPRISAVIMHHPKRAGRLPALLRSCGTLDPRVVADPDPGGPPSPLRTAKRAWAAIGEDATHHLVLQDDVTVIAGFDRHLRAAVAARPYHGITLQMGWNSLPNSYFVRLAAATGSPWAALSPSWTPTYGLVLPAARARELATHLATVPDEVRHDDRVITPYLAGNGIPVLGPVPDLLEHQDTESLADNAADGNRHATAFLPESSVDWAAAPELTARLAERVASTEAVAHAVELHNSECRIRFLRPGSGEPASHAFGWHWYDWCPLLGIDPDAVLADAGPHFGGEPRRLATEVWAAAWLLGHDAATLGGVRPRSAELIRAALLSWIDTGLCATDRRALDASARTRLAELAVTALAHGGKR
jgi:hypothetical protein